MSRSLSLHAALPLVAGIAVIAGCASTSPEVREEVARTEATVQSVQQSGITRDAGGLELEQAKDKVGQARAALDDHKDKRALRLAEQARLDADLAQAKARSRTAQQSAEEVRTSIEQLRRESLRPTDATAAPTAGPSTTTMPPPATTPPAAAPTTTSEPRL